MANEDRDSPQNDPEESGDTANTGGNGENSPQKKDVRSSKSSESNASKGSSGKDSSDSSSSKPSKSGRVKDALKNKGKQTAKNAGMNTEAGQKAAKVAEQTSRAWKASVAIYHKLIAAGKVILATAKIWIPVLIVVAVAFWLVVSGLSFYQTWGRDDPVDTCTILNEDIGGDLREGDYGGSDELIIPGEYQSWLSATASEHDLPMEFLAAQIQHESDWDPNAASHVGAQGLAQFMPATWDAWGEGEISDPQSSIEAQGRYMASLRDTFEPHADGDDHLYSLMLAGYNAGPGAVQSFDYDLEEMFNQGDPDDINSYAGQTAPYVEKIMATSGGNLTITDRGTADCFGQGLPGSPEGMTCGDTRYEEAEDRLNPNALLAWRCVLEAFPPFQEAADEGAVYSLCRPGDPLDHGQGNAIDFMVNSGVDIPGGVLRWNNHPDPTVAAYNNDFDQTTMDYGYSLIDWLIEHSDYFELDYLIFDDSAWYSGTWNGGDLEKVPYNSYPGGGSIPQSDYNYRHLNHVHASFEGPENRCRGGW